ncbi:uncharacterized protein BO87DRAFT_419091 [Aspergillus neoniger CBS 115656]|uniref:C2H2-type domain-containing protein n=1 Tax=Aspergillus neoniger (strain CBS 115656) TaxID=1448310 RepID=A0A318Y789_ASPNB|nr:hypothetical protein BO87DRAFT_419091 [Aspergillus neoniger CBS 115656]PYH30145.1 hypothetical protein BO87DRAFT_419091 [Aspergillus neoniger CBS 115656]
MFGKMGRDEWLNHMRQHRPRWRCAARAHGILVFYEKSEYEEHMRRKHKSTQPQLTILAERSSRPSGPVFQSCPLCDEGNRADLEEHIADHLTYLALMSIPLPQSEANDEYTWMDETKGTKHFRAGGAGLTDSDRSFDKTEMEKAGDPSRLPESPFAGLEEPNQTHTKGKAPAKIRNQGEPHRSFRKANSYQRENTGFFTGRCQWMSSTESKNCEGVEDLLRHIAETHREYASVCPMKVCEQKFADSEDYVKHVQVYHKRLVFTKVSVSINPRFDGMSNKKLQLNQFRNNNCKALDQVSKLNYHAHNDLGR